MTKVYLFASLLVLTSCGGASASALDPSNDLHCAVIILDLQKNSDQHGATPVVKKGLYVLQSWYFSKIKQQQLADAQNVVDAMKSNPGEVSSAARKCSDRAFSDSGFGRWSSFAYKDYDRRVTR